MNVIVTGSNGFVGSEIVVEIVKNDDFVFEVGRNKNSRKISIHNEQSTEFIEADITEYQNFSTFENLKNIDAVVHSAGLAHQFGDIEREKFYKVNVLGTENTTKLAVKIKAKQFILISSTAVYGIKLNVGRKNNEGQIIIDEETICQPETLYAESKLEAENICIEICRRNALPLTILRLSPVIGENNTGNAARLVSAIDNRRFVWIGKGENLKSLIYKKDVARAVVKILKNKKDGIETFNLAAKPIKMKQFVGEIEKNLKKNAPKFYVPSEIFGKIFAFNDKLFHIGKLKKISSTVEKWLSDDIYSARKIKEKYNFEPQTSMAEAVERQVRYYLEGKNKN